MRLVAHGNIILMGPPGAVSGKRAALPIGQFGGLQRRRGRSRRAQQPSGSANAPFAK
jgi:hypothetical protein